MRRRRRSTRNASAWLDWTDSLAEAFAPFDKLVSHLQPPTRARVYLGLRHMTLVARFTDAEGGHVTLKVRSARA